MATVFGWKKKIPHDLSRKRAAAFADNEEEENAIAEESSEPNWLPSSKRLHTVTDNETSSRLRDEGVALAGKQRLVCCSCRCSLIIGCICTNTTRERVLHSCLRVLFVLIVAGCLIV